MMKYISVGLAIVISGLFLFFYLGGFNDGIVETQTDFGALGQKVVITFDDGSQENLLENVPSATVWRNGKSVSHMIFTVLAKVDINKAENVHFTLEDVSIDLKIEDLSGDIIWSDTGVSIDGNYETGGLVYAGSDWVRISEEREVYVSGIFDIVAGAPPDQSYYFTYDVQGKIKYKINGMGDWLELSDFQPIKVQVTYENDME